MKSNFKTECNMSTRERGRSVGSVIMPPKKKQGKKQFNRKLVKLKSTLRPI